MNSGRLPVFLFRKAVGDLEALELINRDPKVTAGGPEGPELSFSDPVLHCHKRNLARLCRLARREKFHRLLQQI